MTRFELLTDIFNIPILKDIYDIFIDLDYLNIQL